MDIILIVLSIVGGIFAFCLPALRGYNLKHISGRIYSFEKVRPYKDTFEGLMIQNLVMMCYEMKKNPYSEEGINLIISMYNLNSGALKKTKSEILEMLKKCDIYEQTPMLSPKDAKERQSKIASDIQKIINSRR